MVYGLSRGGYGPVLMVCFSETSYVYFSVIKIASSFIEGGCGCGCQMSGPGSFFVAILLKGTLWGAVKAARHPPLHWRT